MPGEEQPIRATAEVAEVDAAPRKVKPIIYSRPMFDAADFADESKSVCHFPLRWATFFWSVFFLAGGIVQLCEQVFAAEYAWDDTGRNMLICLAISMSLSGACGLVGAIFEIRYPVTFFSVLLLLQIIVEFCWFVLAERETKEGQKHILQDVAHMLYHEILSGNRSGENGVAAHLFYTLFSVVFHLVACGHVASYALELRINGKTVWFEPIFDDDDDDDEADEEGGLGAQAPSYGAVGSARDAPGASPASPAEGQGSQPPAAQG